MLIRRVYFEAKFLHVDDWFCSESFRNNLLFKLRKRKDLITFMADSYRFDN